MLEQEVGFKFQLFLYPVVTGLLLSFFFFFPCMTILQGSNTVIFLFLFLPYSQPPNSTSTVLVALLCTFLGSCGVFTTTIDPQQHKVTVTGSVGVETLLKKLVRAGKHAEIWPENLDGKGKSSGKAKKKNKARETESSENHSAENKGTESAANCNSASKSSNSKTGDNRPEKSPAGNRGPPEDHKGGQSEGGAEKSGGGGSGKKKKKKKTQSGGSGSSGLSSAPTSAPAHTGFQFQNTGEVVGQQMGQINLSPTRQQSYSFPETGYPPMVYVAATYNRLYPMGRMGGPSYYVPHSPYMCSGLDQDTCQFQSAPLVSFEIFSDENANGCSIM